MKYYLSLLFSLILVCVLQSGSLNIAPTFAIDRIRGEQTSQSVSSRLPMQLIEKDHFNAHPVTVNRIHFSPNGQRLVTASQDGTARLWTSSGQMLAEFKGHNRPVFNASFSPDGQNIITAGYDGTARIWSLSGQHIATVADDGVLRVWDLKGTALATFAISQGRLSGISFSPDGKQIAISGFDGTVWLVSLKT
ncbi:MAG: hypothetical protein PUP91_09365 [Rhizonema sp. PD37]|nr:hypothetical protein [Rhizonema sp. PD37]